MSHHTMMVVMTGNCNKNTILFFCLIYTQCITALFSKLVDLNLKYPIRVYADFETIGKKTVKKQKLWIFMLQENMGSWWWWLWWLLLQLLMVVGSTSRINILDSGNCLNLCEIIKTHNGKCHASEDSWGAFIGLSPPRHRSCITVMVALLSPPGHLLVSTGPMGVKIRRVRCHSIVSCFWINIL